MLSRPIRLFIAATLSLAGHLMAAPTSRAQGVPEVSTRPQSHLSREDRAWLQQSTFLTPFNGSIMDEVGREIDRIRTSMPNVRPIVLVDIDDTVLDGRYSARDALRDYASQSSGPSSETRLKIAAFFAKSPNGLPGHTPGNIARRLDISERSPEFEKFRQHFWKKVMSPEYAARKYPMFAGAVERINDLHQRGARIVYVTARPETEMGQGTRQLVRTSGLPLEADADVVMRPGNAKTADFKVNQFQRFNANGSVAAFIENNAETLVAVEKSGAKNAKLVLLQTKFDHVPDTPAKNLYTASSWHKMGPTTSEVPSVSTGGLGLGARLTKVAMKLGGKLAIYGGISDIVKHVQEQDIVTSLAKGECPARLFVNTDKTFSHLAALDLSTSSEIIAKCRAQGKPMDLSRHSREIIGNSSFGVSQATCSVDGTVRLVHVGGTRSLVKFSSDKTLDSIETIPADLDFSSQTPTPPAGVLRDEAVRFLYVPGDPKEGAKNLRAGRVTKATYFPDGKASSSSESFMSFSARVWCGLNYEECNLDQLHQTLDHFDDSTTARTPFGANSGPPVFGAAAALAMTKQLLIANKTGTISFEEFCPRVSGKAAPEAVNFSESPRAPSPKPSGQAAPDPATPPARP